jgi:hypothetical protein
MWCAINDVSNSVSKSCGGGSRDTRQDWPVSPLTIALFTSHPFLRPGRVSSYHLYLSRWFCSSRRQVRLLLPDGHVGRIVQVWYSAVNPSGTIYMQVPIPIQIKSWWYRGKDKVESMSFYTLPVHWTKRATEGWWIDEELLQYGLPNDIWFHVEQVPSHSPLGTPPSEVVSPISCPSILLSFLSYRHSSQCRSPAYRIVNYPPHTSTSVNQTHNLMENGNHYLKLWSMMLLSWLKLIVSKVCLPSHLLLHLRTLGLG